MNRNLLDDIGKLVLRVTIAGLMLPHGVAKLKKGVAKIGDRLAQHGLPEFISYGVIVGEGAVAIALFGAGRFALRRGVPRWD